MEKMAWDGPRWDPRSFFPTNPDLTDIFGRTDLNFETFFFLFSRPQISGCPGPQISKFLDFQVPISPNSQIPRFPGSQISRCRRRQPRRTNSQMPTWPLSQRTQGSITSQGPLLRPTTSSIAYLKSSSLPYWDNVHSWLCHDLDGCTKLTAMNSIPRLL